MSDQASPNSEVVSARGMRRLDEICARFEDAWQAGQRPRIEDYLGDVPGPQPSHLLRELLVLELAYRRQNNEAPTPEEYRQRFPQQAELVEAVFLNPLSRMQVAESSNPQVSTGWDLAVAQEADQPVRLGRYQIKAKLGAGGFGVVYRAYDEELRRDVAIKVPHRRRISQPEDVEKFLAEARVLARLDHPHIVPVHDVGRTEDGLCYVVSKFIEGSDLARKIKEARPSFAESAELMAAIAEALHYAHRQGLIHRDVKPANVLIDVTGKSYVTDFGLALREEDYGKGPTWAGTPAYMSPEQARGEGHRVDGRSDIFSLGVVFYELLTRRRPFTGDTNSELLDKIASLEPRPPRQVDDTIPKELERICLKALSKRATERYTTAKDLADDLRHWLGGAESQASMRVDIVSLPPVQVQFPAPLPATATPAPPPTKDTEQAIKIVPKGLRSFDAGDADFFLELLPGPRDREGLPDSIRFWKSRIEEQDPDQTFPVGLIYGPSGCGKSSLVKAGLLPRLADDVIAVYVEATAEETEGRLLKGLRKRCPDLPNDLGLIEALAALRRGRGIPAGKKALMVLDQFEQWLHAKREEQNTELVQALRQCDGGRVQAVVLVRDDFWMAATRFMARLEISLVQGQNCAAVDLFDLLHARKVLAEFGRAYGRLTDQLGEGSPDQDAFLEQAIAGLAQDGKVISVRLALFAEMVKGKPWTPATLREVGGTEGVGVTFLEETFAATTAPPQHRLHHKAAQAVLKALLPEAGSDIKGTMRSQQYLLEASGYAGRPTEFADLMHILDNELRLVTPTEPTLESASPVASAPGELGALTQPRSPECYYQLTHDYLVPSLRDWLTRKLKETRRGRAELLLADRAAVWHARPEKRQLPSLWQWLQIRWLTQKKDWTPPQRKMMATATGHHVLRATVAVVLLAVASFTGLAIREQVVEQRNATLAAGLVQSLLNADTAQVPAIVGGMTAYRTWTDPLLRVENDAAAENSRQKLHTSLALLPVDATQVDYLDGRLLDASPPDVAVIRDFLAPQQEALRDKLWAVVEAPARGQEAQRLRAAAALAKYDPQGERWAKVSRLVVHDLVRENPVHLLYWSEAYRAVKDSFLQPLADIFRDQRPERAAERSLATNLLADYAADHPPLLADLLMDGDEKQFAVIYPKVKAEESGALLTEIDKKLPSDLPSSDDRREKLARRQANAAVALLKLNQPEKVWPLLRRTPPDDPRVRSYLIHRFGPLRADVGALVKRLEEEPDVTIRRALLLSLGPEEFAEEAWTPEGKKLLVQRLQEMYRTADDPGLHAAAEWLLRQWHEEAWLKQTDEAWAKDKGQCEKRLQHILASGEASARRDHVGLTPRRSPQWYVNGQGQTMVVIAGPVEFRMGSPSTEDGRQGVESQHQRRIGRTFALAAKPVTVSEFRRFLRANKLEAWFERGGHAAPLMKRYSPDENGPIILVDWYTAAAYCNWLSEQEGISPEQWCYETNAQRLSQEKVSATVLLLLQRHPLAAASASSFLVDRQPQVTVLRKNYLSLQGYRLPTEAEWEYACRAGAVTGRYYGETEELLPKYGWYLKNSGERTWPPGRKKPNDLGLFDMHGNVWTWGQESYRGDYAIPKDGGAIDDPEDTLSIVSTTSRVLRGGSFYIEASYLRSAIRVSNAPAIRIYTFGFRPARTFTAE